MKPKPTKPIEIFRAGTHRPMQGEAVTITERDLDAVVASYAPKRHEAPLVIGHPKDNDPAFGWVERLYREGASLFAVPKQLEPSFAEAVGAGRFKKVSASFYPPSSPSNPTPGKWALRHVGFLGAMAPAVKGLAAVSFAAADTDFVSFAAEVDDEAVMKAATASLPGAVATAIDALLGTMPTGATPDAGAVEQAKTSLVESITAVITAALETGRASAAPEPAPDTTDLAEGEELIGAARGLMPDAIEAALPAEVADRDAVKGSLVEAVMTAITAALEQVRGNADASSAATADLAEHRARREQLDARELELRKRETAANRQAHVSFLDALLAQGKPVPCKRELVLSFMELLDGVKPDVVSFGENEKRTPLELFKTELLERLPKQVTFGPVVGDFAEGGEDDPQVIAKRADTYRAEMAAKGVVVSTSEAVRHVRKGA